MRQRHDGVDGGAHVVRFEAADEGVEAVGGWADAHEEGDFDEDDDEGADAGEGGVLAIRRVKDMRMEDQEGREGRTGI